MGDDRAHQSRAPRTTRRPRSAAAVEPARVVDDGDAVAGTPGPHVVGRRHHDDGKRPGGREHPVGHALGQLGAWCVVERLREPGLARPRTPGSGSRPPRARRRDGVGNHESAYATERGRDVRRRPLVAVATSALRHPVDDRGGADDPGAGPGDPGEQPRVVPRPAGPRLPRRPTAAAGAVPGQGRAVRQAAARIVPARRAPDPGAAGDVRRSLVARRRGRRRSAAASASPCSPKARSRSTSSRWSGKSGTARLAQASGVAGHAGRPVGRCSGSCSRAESPSGGPASPRSIVGRPAGAHRARRGRARGDRPDHERRSARRWPGPARSTRRPPRPTTTAGGCAPPESARLRSCIGGASGA